jgi:hypothetical protein
MCIHRITKNRGRILYEGNRVPTSRELEDLAYCFESESQRVVIQLQVVIAEMTLEPVAKRTAQANHATCLIRTPASRQCNTLRGHLSRKGSCIRGERANSFN